ncbi:exported hypothetical protein [Mesorhizobium metallidurans STM 2683]|uniref:Uncharacterized protein n=1 Tax=Mesorhizobium metallidurans STM 2683 TaxID=1297569 RepID=M5EWN9_9HYPH|nr:hypothetical protein [Mesorhizobium metallidurans]CCV08370.1 exported hypothetical protein [Mesorhizobium metallidurans STM 2683]
MMARWSPKHVLVLLLAVFLTTGFSLSAAQANVMSARMTMAADKGMTMPANTSRAKMADATMNGDCKACLKDAAGSDNPVRCPPSCIAPVVAVLPQGLAVTTAPGLRQPSALRAPFPRGRSFLPDPYPPRPSA